MNGVSAALWKLNRTFSARGSTHRYATLAPARNRTMPTENAGMITRRSLTYKAGARNAHT